MILISWWGLPQYAARAIGAFVRQTKERVVVVSTPPTVPITGMERVAGCPIVWVRDELTYDKGEAARLINELGEIPRVLISGNWNLPMYVELARQVRANGGTAVIGSDANYVLDFKQILRAIRFRLSIRAQYDYYFVPGKSGRRLMEFFGAPKNRIFEGLYAADEGLFKSVVPINKREKKIIYVGQFIERKNVLRLVEAFVDSGIVSKGWRLELNGSGVLKEELVSRSAKGVVVNGFVQPEQLAEKYQEARCFVLPSLEEHWGVVVHEAALSGCYLLLSSGIGAADDFACAENSGVFDPMNVHEMSAAMRRMADMTEEEMTVAEAVSKRLGLEAGLDKFVRAMNEMVAR